MCNHGKSSFDMGYTKLPGFKVDLINLPTCVDLSLEDKVMAKELPISTRRFANTSWLVNH